MKKYPIKCNWALIGLFLVGNLAAAEKVHFNRDIRPILSDRCFQCHGPHAEDRKGDLRLDITDGLEGALTRREDYFVIKPGEPYESELIWRISDDFEEDRMPPPEAHKPTLSEEEIGLFKQWILEGAEYQDYWAYIPPEISKPTEVKDKSWNRNPVDHYVMASLEKEGLLSDYAGATVCSDGTHDCMETIGGALARGAGVKQAKIRRGIATLEGARHRGLSLLSRSNRLDAGN